MSWVAESRQPDGTWRQLFIGSAVKDVLRQLRRWKRDQGHLLPETRLRGER